MRLRLLAVVSVVVFQFCACRPARHQGHGRTALDAPSDRYPTIQSAIDAAVDGDTVRIPAGTFDETLFVDGKRITIEGAGARGKGRTELRGALPTGIPDPELGTGIVNYGPGGGGALKYLGLRGGDAGVAGHELRGGIPAGLECTDLLIQEGGRGIVGTFSVLTVADVEITRTWWHGVSLFKSVDLVSALQANFIDVYIHETGGFGFYCKDMLVDLKDCTFIFNSRGGLVLESGISNVRDCVAGLNGGFGFLFVDGFHVVEDAHVFMTVANNDGKFGDGVGAANEALLSVADSVVDHNARAGFSSFSAHVALSGNTMECNVFHLAGEETLPGVPFFFEDQGGNTCGCDGTEETCQVESPGISALEAIDLSN